MGETMQIKSIISIIGGVCSKEFEGTFQKIKTNSKEINKGDIFLAINNGYQYADEALEKGAIAVITEKEGMGENYIYVPSTIEALGKIAKFYKEYYQKPMIAITGSAGKTTTKEFISTVLSKKYKILKSEKNHNNHIGLPETLLKLNDDIDIVVLEMGMNHFNEISYLSNICNPNYAVITNIGTAHIGNLGSKKNILKAKLEIIEGMEKGILLLNGKDRLLKKVTSNKVKIKKTKWQNCKHIKYQIDKTEFTYVYKKRKYPFIINIPGKHILEDCLLAIDLGLLLGISIEDIQKAVSEFKNEEGRYEIYQKDITIIDDTYNSSYESLKQGLLLLKKRKEHKMIILGDMLEFGQFSKKYHKKINLYLRKIKNKQVFLLGEQAKVIKGKHFETIASLQNHILSNIQKGDIVFVKGSHAMQLEQIVQTLKNNN